MTTAASVTSPWARGLLLLIVAAGLALRLYRLDAQSFWMDEADVFGQASRPDVWAVMGDRPGYPEPPLYAVVLHYWLRLGTSDAHARLLSALFGAATIPLSYALLAPALSPAIALAGAGLLAVSPFHVWYSQEARMYAMLVFLAAAATLCLWRALHRPRAMAWIGYALTLAACGATHMNSIFLAVAHATFVLIWYRRRGRALAAFLAAGLAAGLLVTPLIVGFLRGGSPVPQAGKPVTLATIPYLFFAESVGFSFGPSIYEVQAHLSPWVAWPYWKAVLASLVVFATLFAAGIRHAWREHREAWWLLVLVLVLPLLGPLVVDVVAADATVNPRHVIVSLVGYVGLLGAGVIGLGRRLGMLALGGVLLLSAVSLSNLYGETRYAKEDARGAAAYLQALDGTNAIGLVVKYPWPIQHYYRGTIPLVGPRALGDTAGGLLDARLRDLVQGREQLIFIDLRAWHYDREGRVERACDRLFERLEERRLHGVRLVRYAIRAPRAHRPAPAYRPDAHA